MSLKLTAQVDTLVDFYDKDLNITTPDSATYVEFATKNMNNDSLWQTAIVNVKTRYPILKGFYKDTLLSIGEGKFEIFNDYGIKAMEGNYVDGKKNGLWLTWNDNAQLLDSAIYINDSTVTEWSYNYASNNQITQRSYSNTITKEKESFDYSADDGHLYYEVHYKEGNAYKHEITYHTNGKLKTDITEEQKKIVDKHYYDTTGKEINEKEYFKLNAAIAKTFMPELPGGIDGFMGFVTNAIKRENSLSNEKGIAFRITITFLLNSKGEPNNINVYSSSDEINRIVANAVQGMPKWKMHGLSSYGPLTRTLIYRIER